MLKDKLTVTKIIFVYFIMNVGFAVWRIYYNVFLEENSLSGTQIGTINAIFQAIMPFVLTFWGLIADKKGIRPILALLIFISSILLVFLTKLTDFWLLLLFIPVLGFFYHPIAPLIDALSVSFIDNNKTKTNYGQLRSFGSLGWGVSSIIAGIVFTFLPIKYIFITSSIIFLFALPVLIVPKRRKKIYRPDTKPFNFKIILKNKFLMKFIFILIFYGLSSTSISNFLNLYFKDLGASNKIIGYAYAIQALSEVPFFFVGYKLIKKFGSPVILMISFFVMFVRLFLYGITKNIFFALFLCVLQGFTLSFFFVAVVDFMNKLMPKGQHAMSQSIIWGGYYGIGITIGNLFVGVVKDLFGMNIAMLISSAITFLTLGCAILFFRKLTIFNKFKNMLYFFKKKR